MQWNGCIELRAFFLLENNERKLRNSRNSAENMKMILFTTTKFVLTTDKIVQWYGIFWLIFFIALFAINNNRCNTRHVIWQFDQIVANFRLWTKYEIVKDTYCRTNNQIVSSEESSTNKNKGNEVQRDLRTNLFPIWWSSSSNLQKWLTWKQNSEYTISCTVVQSVFALLLLSSDTSIWATEQFDIMHSTGKFCENKSCSGLRMPLKVMTRYRRNFRKSWTI